MAKTTLGLFFRKVKNWFVANREKIKRVIGIAKRVVPVVVKLTPGKRDDAALDKLGTFSDRVKKRLRG